MLCITARVLQGARSECRVRPESWVRGRGYLYFVLLFQIMGSRVVEGTCTVVVSNTGFCICIRICIRICSCMHCICTPYRTFCDCNRCICVITLSVACFVSIANVACRFLNNLVTKVDYRNFTGLSSRQVRSDAAAETTEEGSCMLKGQCSGNS